MICKHVWKHTVPIISPFLCLWLFQGWNLRSLLEPDWLFETNNHRHDLRCADVPITAEKSWACYHRVTIEVVYGYLWQYMAVWLWVLMLARPSPFRRRWSLKGSKRESGATWAEVAGHEPELGVRRIAFKFWFAFGQTKWRCWIYACPKFRWALVGLFPAREWHSTDEWAWADCFWAHSRIYDIIYAATHTDRQPHKSYQPGEESLAGRSWYRFRKKAYRLINWFR